MIILGIWDGHDAGAALIVDGQLVASVNEERLTRRKLEIRFPTRSIQCCLQIARLTVSDVNLVVSCTSDVAKTLGRWFPGFKEDYHRIRRRKVQPSRFATLRKNAKYRLTEWRGNRLTRMLSERALRRTLSQMGLLSAQLELFDHHECHARAAAWASGYSRCAVLTIDGVGDGLSSTISVFADGSLTRVAASPACDSLGVFFEHVTNLLNMRELEDEGKVMALADYAAPVPDDLNPLLSMFTVRDGRLNATLPGHRMMGHLRSVLWQWPNEQFAYMAQRTVEEVCVQLARDAVRLTGLSQIALAGGVVSNVKANRRIRLLPQVEDVYVFPHMGDGGLALGAALAGASSRGGVVGGLSDLGLGPEYSDDETAAALRLAGVVAIQPANVVERVADLIAAGSVVMWFQGRMEYGPRALGSRSVIARPDRLELRERLNLVLKQRVWYQPFCPSMLEGEASRILMDYTARSNRSMTMAYVVAPQFRDALVGVTSIDGSCRPQVVRDDAEGLFADVLRAVKARTGLGVVLNTSYNIHGEPLVCTPEEAIDVYLRTGADALAIGSYVVVRESKKSLSSASSTHTGDDAQVLTDSGVSRQS
jgi:carbamoyltransferase